MIRDDRGISKVIKSVSESSAQEKGVRSSVNAFILITSTSPNITPEGNASLGNDLIRKLLKCNLTRGARVLKKTLLRPWTPGKRRWSSAGFPKRKRGRWVGWWGSTVDTQLAESQISHGLAKLPWSSLPGPVTWNMKSLFKRDRKSGGCKKSLIGKLFDYCPHLPIPPWKVRLHLSSI